MSYLGQPLRLNGTSLYARRLVMMSDPVSGIDDDLGDGKGCLRDYVKTGLIARSQVEGAKSGVSYEAIFEAPNTHPGTSPTTTVKISEEAYSALGEAGVP